MRSRHYDFETSRGRGGMVSDTIGASRRMLSEAIAGLPSVFQNRSAEKIRVISCLLLFVAQYSPELLRNDQTPLYSSLFLESTILLLSRSQTFRRAGLWLRSSLSQDRDLPFFQFF